MTGSKGQVQVVSAVLLTGIMISLVAVAYFWGLPVIEKQKDRSRLDQAGSFMRNLNSAIKEVANEGGRRELSVQVPGKLEFSQDPDKKYRDNITLTFESSGSLIATNQTIYLVGNDRPEVPITSESGVVTALSEPVGGKYRIKMRLYYKNLTSVRNTTYRVDLNNLGRSSIGQREATITIQKAEAPPVGGEDFYLNRVNIRFQ